MVLSANAQAVGQPNAINTGSKDVSLAWGRFVYSIKAGEEKFIPASALSALTRRYPEVQLINPGSKASKKVEAVVPELPPVVEEEPLADEELALDGDLDLSDKVLDPDVVDESELDLPPVVDLPEEGEVSKKKKPRGK